MTQGPGGRRRLAAIGHPERYPGLTSWTPQTFEVTSGAPIEIGLDGETEVAGELRQSEHET